MAVLYPALPITMPAGAPSASATSQPTPSAGVNVVMADSMDLDDVPELVDNTVCQTSASLRSVAGRPTFGQQIRSVAMAAVAPVLSAARRNPTLEDIFSSLNLSQ